MRLLQAGFGVGGCVLAGVALVWSCSCTSSTGPTSSSASAVVAAASCPRAGPPTTTGRVDSPEIDEASGIAASAVNDGVFWLHNDSGDSARAFAVRRTGELLATLVFDTADAVDIEDMAIEDAAPGQSYLYFGDIGDNRASRKSLTIHRVAEPTLGGTGKPALTAVSEKMRITYPDGSHDAETLLFDPVTKDLFLATKRLFGGAGIYRVGPFTAGALVTTERVGTVSVDLATGGDISRDGRFIAIRNYGSSAFVWTREPGESVAVALSRTPCSVPVAAEAQGEAFGFLPGGAQSATGYVTVSEGSTPDLHVAAILDEPRSR